MKASAQLCCEVAISQDILVNIYNFRVSDVVCDLSQRACPLSVVRQIRNWPLFVATEFVEECLGGTTFASLRC